MAHAAQFTGKTEQQFAQEEQEPEYASEEERDAVGYNRKGSVEYDAHALIEPMLAKYIFSGKTGKELIRTTPIPTDIKSELIPVLKKYNISKGTEVFGLAEEVKTKGAQQAMADYLRTKKFKGGAMMTVDFGITRAVYNGALEVMARQLEKGSKLGNAIAYAMKWVDGQLGGKKWDKGGFIDEITRQISPEAENILADAGEISHGVSWGGVKYGEIGSVKNNSFDNTGYKSWNVKGFEYGLADITTPEGEKFYAVRVKVDPQTGDWQRISDEHLLATREQKKL